MYSNCTVMTPFCIFFGGTEVTTGERGHALLVIKASNMGTDTKCFDE